MLVLRSRTAVGAILLSLVTLAALAKEDPKKPYVGSAAPALSPQEAQKHFKAPAGFEMRLFAAEPDVVNPVAMSFDEKGRLWVVELYEYPYEKPKGETRKGRDRVICLEDPDGVGHATKRTVVVEDLWLATAITFGNGGIYVGQAPDLYFYPITETPDGPKAGERKTVLTGFGLEDKHELLNSFCWGPDGWMYFTHGVFTHSNVRNPRKPNEVPIKFDAGVGRYNPRTDTFEVWCDGISNQWGVDWDKDGNAFVSACVVDHIWHVVPGGVYQRQGGVPTIPYTYELLPPINKDKHRHYMAAYAGINIYQGNLFPEQYRGTAFMGNIHGNCLDHDKLTPDGSSFTATDLRTASDTGEFLEANDDWFRPVSTQTGPDGALWIMDWYDKYPCYQNSHAPDLDREKGRIWRLVYVGDQAGKEIATHEKGMDLGKLSDDQLVALLSHPNIWQRRVAQRVLKERLEKRKMFPRELVELALKGPTLDARLAALWTLGSVSPDGVYYQVADRLATAPEAPLRVWIARYLGEMRPTAGDAEPIALLLKLAADKDPTVLAAVAESARRLADHDTTAVITTLAHQPAAQSDPHLPFLIWRATEARMTAQMKTGRAARDVAPGEAQLAVAVDAGEPVSIQILKSLATDAGKSPAAAQLSRKIVRRLIDANDTATLKSVADFVNTLKPDQSAVALGAVQGLLDVQPKKGVVKPEGAAGLNLDRLAASDNAELKSAAGRLAALWGSAAAAEAGLKAINDGAASADDRLKSIRLASQLNTDAARNAVSKLIASDAPEGLRLEAVRTLGEIGNEQSADVILASLKTLSPQSRRSAVEVLTSRLPWAMALVKAVQAKQIPLEDVSATALRTMNKLNDKQFQALFTKTIGRYRESDPDKQKTIAAKKLVMLNGPVDYEAGHALMQKTCLVCHTFYGEGAHVGPDLTGVGRSSVDALLNNVIDPNQIIGAGYENTIVETKDGRSLSGRLVEETPDQVKLLSAGDKEDVVAKADVKSLRTEKISVMPEGLVDTLSDQDLRNLLWYVYEPVQDNKDKRLRIDLSADAGLRVSAKPAGSGEMVPLIDATTKGGLPRLAVVRDPRGEVAFTDPATGIYFDLAGEAKLKAAPRATLVDLNAANDRATWRWLVRWTDDAGTLIAEEEQQFDVHAIDSPDHYTIDTTRTLRALHGELNVLGSTPGIGLAGRPESNGLGSATSIGDRRVGVAALGPRMSAAPKRIERGKDWSFSNPLVIYSGAWKDEWGRGTMDPSSH